MRVLCVVACCSCVLLLRVVCCCGCYAVFGEASSLALLELELGSCSALHRKTERVRRACSRVSAAFLAASRKGAVRIAHRAFTLQ